jgi:hypothetical protein
MTGLEYVNKVLSDYAVAPTKALQYHKVFRPYIADWANGYLVDVKISGSSAKGTAVSSGTDVDFFISLTSNLNTSLSEIYTSLYSYMSNKGFTVRRQNVSIGVDYNSDQIDLVPAKRQSQFGNDHSLYVSKLDTWKQTNIDTHISYVSKSNRLDEIKLTKIWRDKKQLDFPSFYLELVVIDALKGCLIGATDTNFIKVLRFIESTLETKNYIDPANTNNYISEQISIAEKKRIALQAKLSADQTYWRDII